MPQMLVKYFSENNDCVHFLAVEISCSEQQRHGSCYPINHQKICCEQEDYALKACSTSALVNSTERENCYA